MGSGVTVTLTNLDAVKYFNGQSAMKMIIFFNCKLGATWLSGPNDMECVDIRLFTLPSARQIVYCEV